MNKILIRMIRFYQNTISYDHSKGYVFCKFTPSCSEYAVLALKKHGFIIAVIKSVYRIIRCNPFTKGGIDLP